MAVKSNFLSVTFCGQTASGIEDVKSMNFFSFSWFTFAMYIIALQNVLLLNQISYQ